MTDYIHKQAVRLIKQFHTNDPFELLDCLNVTIRYSNTLKDLKGFCICVLRSFYVVINDSLSEEEKRIVAAHELGHCILHKQKLKQGQIQDYVLYDNTSKTEREANLFAADLLLSDENIFEHIPSLNKDYIVTGAPDTIVSQYCESTDLFHISCTLNVPPELMCFKLLAMKKRGFLIPDYIETNSRFLSRPSAYQAQLHKLLS